MTLLLVLTLACTRSGPKDPGETPTGGDGGGTTSTTTDGGSTVPDGGTTDGGGTTSTDGGGTDGRKPIPTAACPPPPDDAVVFHAGTVVVDQVYAYFSYNSRHEEGWHLIATGLSYDHDLPCEDAAWGNVLFDDIKLGRAPEQFWFEFSLFLPGLSIEGWLGEHTLEHGPYPAKDRIGHNLKIGWRDTGATYPSMVSSLPNGWTESKVCVGTISPDYLYLTVLWDPKDGPYRTNDFVRTDQPIWFDMEIWPTGGSDPADPAGSRHRSCAVTSQTFLAGSPVESMDEIFGAYDWPAREF